MERHHVVAGGGIDCAVHWRDSAESPGAGQLWFNSAQARLYIYYNDGNTTQWVPSAPIPGPTPPPSAGTTRVKFTKYLASGSWTPDPLMLYGQAMAKGGGGNSGVVTVHPNYCMGAAAVARVRRPSSISMWVIMRAAGRHGRAGSGGCVRHPSVLGCRLGREAEFVGWQAREVRLGSVI